MVDQDEIKRLEEQLRVIVDNLAKVEKEFETDTRIKRQIISNLKHQEKILREAIDERKGK